MDIYARCEAECKSERCDDYGADVCVAWHGSGAKHAAHGFCGKAAFLSFGCEVCQEYQAIQREIEDGETPKRVCHECLYLFEIDADTPFGAVLFQEGVGVYFECDDCFVVESDEAFDDDRIF